MSGRKSERLRLSEVRGVFRLVGECCDLGADPEAWRSHITRSLGSLAGGQVSMSGEAAKPIDGSTPGFLYQAVDRGWATPSDREIWASFQASEGYMRRADPPVDSIVRRSLWTMPPDTRPSTTQPGLVHLTTTRPTAFVGWMRCSSRSRTYLGVSARTSSRCSGPGDRVSFSVTSDG